MLLGVIAMKFEGKLEWDAKKMRIHKQHRGEQVPEAEVPQGMEIRVMRS